MWCCGEGHCEQVAVNRKLCRTGGSKIDMDGVTLYSLSSDRSGIDGFGVKSRMAFRKDARVAQWIRAFASGAKGRWFESSRGYLFFWSSPRYFISLRPTFVATSGSFL